MAKKTGLEKDIDEVLEGKEITEDVYFQTGCTVLDLVLGGGMCMGVNQGVLGIAGDPGAGKTQLIHEITAANYHKHRKAKEKFLYMYDPVEAGSKFSTQDTWNLPEVPEEDRLCSVTVEDADANIGIMLKRCQKANCPGIYATDSIDGLSSTNLQERAEEREKNMLKDGEASNKNGSRNVDVPSFLSKELFRNRMVEIERSNLLWICISQTRQNMDAGMFQPKKQTSGGEALKFFTSNLLWLTVAKKLIKTVDGRDYQIGCIVKAQTKKSRTPRPFRTCYYTLYYETGISDVESSLNFLFDLLDDRFDHKPTAEHIAWEAGGKVRTKESDEQWIVDNGHVDACKSDRKAIEGKSNLTAKWIKDWLDIHASEEVRAEFLKQFGKTYTFIELRDMIYDSPEMQEELRQRVMDKWELIEKTVSANVPRRKYAD